MILSSSSGVDGLSVVTDTVFIRSDTDNLLRGDSSGCICGYSPVPVAWHPVHSIVLQILIIHFGFYQPFHQGTSLQGLPLSSSCHIANAIHLIVLGDNIQHESYLDRRFHSRPPPDSADGWCIGSGCVSIYQVSVSQGRVTLVLLPPLYLTDCFSSGISHWLYPALSCFIAVRVTSQHQSVRIDRNSKQANSLISPIFTRWIISCFHLFTLFAVTVSHMFLPARLWHDWGGWWWTRHSPARATTGVTAQAGAAQTSRRQRLGPGLFSLPAHSALAHFSSKAESDIAGFATPLSISRKMDRPGLEWKDQTAKITNWDRGDEKIFLSDPVCQTSNRHQIIDVISSSSVYNCLRLG